MDGITQLEACADELATAARNLANYCRNAEIRTSTSTSPSTTTAPPEVRVPPEAPDGAHQARRTVLASAAKLQTMLSEPTEFLQRLAGQTQLAACLRWLGDFQVLACLPPSGSVPVRDVAHLSMVQESQLAQVVRMTATVGFLHEPQAGDVAHTSLSAQFVTNAAFRDAAMFLAEYGLPSALQMATATRRSIGESGNGGANDGGHHGSRGAGRGHRDHGAHGKGNNNNNSSNIGYPFSAYSLAFDTLQTFPTACEQRPKLQRQWAAYLQFTTHAADESIADVLTRLDWGNLGSNARVVEVGAPTSGTATILVDRFPSLHFVVQLREPSSQHLQRQHQQQQQQQQSSASSSSSSSQTSHASRRPPPPPPPRSATATAAASPTNNNGATRTTWPAPDTNPRITVQTRTLGSPQPVADATVYILHLPSSPSSSSAHHCVRGVGGGEAGGGQVLLAELHAHFNVLAANNNHAATLILTARLLPEPGSVPADVEAAARLRDLSLSQLTTARELEVAELVDLVNGVSDGAGRLAVVDKLRSRNNASVVALVAKYQPAPPAFSPGVASSSHAPPHPQVHPHELLATTTSPLMMAGAAAVATSAAAATAVM